MGIFSSFLGPIIQDFGLGLFSALFALLTSLITDTASFGLGNLTDSLGIGIGMGN